MPSAAEHIARAVYDAEWRLARTFDQPRLVLAWHELPIDARRYRIAVLQDVLASGIISVASGGREDLA